MIYLNPIEFRAACKEHCKALKPKILKKLNSNKPQLFSSMKRLIINNLDDILMGEPDRLMQLHSQYFAIIKSWSTRSVKRNTKQLKKIFDYKNFTKKKEEYNAYTLANNLNIKTCVYCNRSYTVTVKIGKTPDGQLTRPQFDHYFAKVDYPLLALSFFNLIPSCSICNSTLKGKIEFDLTNYLHPYIDDCFPHFQFSYKPTTTAGAQGATSQNKVVIDTNQTTNKELSKKIETTFNVFKIKEIYDAHADEISDLLKIRQHMGDRYLQELKTTYKLKITDDELYRLAFGTYRQEADFHKRPFSKLKKDILKELGMI